MSDPFFEKFIAALKEGAEKNSRANGGPGVNVIVDRENHGREEKLASLGAMQGNGLRGAYQDGARRAMVAFGIKEANVLGGLMSMAGSVGGGMLARKALPQLGGIAGHAAEMGGQMLGGVVGQKLAPPQQPPQSGM